MRKYFVSLGSSVLFVLCALLSNMVGAQTNVIPEVKLSNQDGFSELRQLIGQNFNYTIPGLTEGSFTSVVEFNLSKDGKIKDVSASGACPYVSDELKNVLSELQYKPDMNKLGAMATNTHFSMPVTVNINNGFR